MIRMFLRFIAIPCMLFCAIISGSVQAIVFVTHGFNGADQSWYQPGGDFYESLKISAAQNGHDIKHFTWDQSFLSGAQKSSHHIAGSDLALAIIEFCQKYTFNPTFPKNHKVIVVAHSYGGLVAAHASIFLEKFLISTKHKQPMEQISTHMSKMNEEKLVVMQNQLEKLNWFAQNWQPEALEPIISNLITLGTPHQENYSENNPEQYTAFFDIFDTKVVPSSISINEAHTLFSTGDEIAHPGSKVGNSLPPKTVKSKNVLLIARVENCAFGPDHSQLHAPSVAKVIFGLINNTLCTQHLTEDYGIIAIEMPEAFRSRHGSFYSYGEPFAAKKDDVFSHMEYAFETPHQQTAYFAVPLSSSDNNIEHIMVSPTSFGANPPLAFTFMVPIYAIYTIVLVPIEFSRKGFPIGLGKL